MVRSSGLPALSWDRIHVRRLGFHHFPPLFERVATPVGPPARYFGDSCNNPAAQPLLRQRR